MGLLSWLFPTPEDRLKKAHAALAASDWAEARDIAMALDLPEAKNIVETAERALCEVNLAHAVSWASAGDAERIQIHMELAADFRKEGMEEAFRAARRDIEEHLHGHARAKKAEASARAQREAQVAPSYLSGVTSAPVALPEGVSEEEAEALSAQLAILIDNYPEHLRKQVTTLGAPFIESLLALEDGRVNEAIATLVALPDDVAVVLFERGRAAMAAGDPRAAVRSWRQFEEANGGHASIGDRSTAVLLADALTRMGQLQEALDVIEVARKDDPFIAGGLYPALLEGLGRLGDAEAAWRHLLQRYGGQDEIYLGIARVRLKAGKRMEAMQALEKSLHQSACKKGTCGYRPPGLATQRLLATLYLEDGIETPRALELAEAAGSLVKQPMWEDAYLSTLVAKTRGEPAWLPNARKLHELTPAGDPRQGALHQHLPLPADA